MKDISAKIQRLSQNMKTLIRVADLVSVSHTSGQVATVRVNLDGAGVLSNVQHPHPAGFASWPTRGKAILVRIQGGEPIALQLIDPASEPNLAAGETVIYSPASGAKVHLKADGTVIVNGNNIKLGSDAAQALVKGDAFRTLYNGHTHTIPDGVSGPPQVSMGSAQLSSKVKTE